MCYKYREIGVNCVGSIPITRCLFGNRMVDRIFEISCNYAVFSLLIKHVEQLKYLYKY